MNELLSKVSSYNLFNYLFPGAVFSIFADRFGVMHSPDEVVAQLLWYYFVGLAISRVGSVVLEPIFRRFSFVEHSEYSDYLRASATDPKLEVMVEVANTYRTIATAFVLLLMSLLCYGVASVLGIPLYWRETMMLPLLAALFALSFRKQSGFVTKRVRHHGGA